jgi:hypothetical protein
MQRQVDQNIVDFVADFMTDEIEAFGDDRQISQPAMQPLDTQQGGMLMESGYPTPPPPPKKKSGPRMKQPPPPPGSKEDKRRKDREKYTADQKAREKTGKNRSPFGDSLMRELDTMMSEEGQINELFGLGRKKQAAAEPAAAEPAAAEPAPEPTGFQFSQAAGQSADAFAKEVLQQLTSVLGRPYGAVRSKGAEGTFVKKLKSFWGKASNAIGSMQDAQTAGQVTERIKQMANDAIHEVGQRGRPKY